MRNAELNEELAGIKIAGRNMNNLRYIAENDELKSLLMKLKEWKTGLKLKIQKTKIMVSGPITSWQIDGRTRETMEQWQTLFWGAPESLLMVTAAVKLKDTCSLEEELSPT